MDIDHPTPRVTELTCISCDRQLEPTWNFCPKCGTPTGQSTPTTFQG